MQKFLVVRPRATRSSDLHLHQSAFLTPLLVHCGTVPCRLEKNLAGAYHTHLPSNFPSNLWWLMGEYWLLKRRLVMISVIDLWWSTKQDDGDEQLVSV